MAARVLADITLDELRKFVPKFVNATTLEVGNELKRQAALLIRNKESGFGLISITPPLGGDDDAKAVGENAVRNDIQKVFVTKAALAAAIGRVSTRGSKTAFNRYIRNGDYEGAKKFLNEQTTGSVRVKGYTTKRKGKTITVKPYTQSRDVSALNIDRLGFIQDIAATPNAGPHQSRRRKGGQEAGRVNKPFWAQVVLKKPSLGQYIKERQKRVGMLKAGWARAASQAQLSVSVPAFVRRNVGKAQGGGRISVANPQNMFVELINASAVASSKIKKQNVDFLVSVRQDNIAKEMEHRMSRLAKAA
jgi:hypothetical protein